MSPHRDRLAVLLLATGVALSGCSQAEELGEASNAAVHVRRVSGEQPSVTLARRAETAVALRTERVAQSGTGDTSPTYQVVPYSAVVYDTTGGTWAYLRTGPRTYARSAITLDHIVGDLAYLRPGLDPAAQVVTVGAAELLGAEEGVGGE